MAGRVFGALQKESSLRSLHLAGGEPTLQMDLLVELIRMGVGMGLPIEYVETNAFWCKDRERVRSEMERLRDAGLPAILISVSMFHNEFVPFTYTRNCAEVAQSVFGPGGVILYLPQMYALLSRMPDEGKHSLEQFISWAGIEGNRGVIPQLYRVIPSGRAAEALRDCYQLQPAEIFRKETCHADLFSTTHFHIDHHGNLFTGLCAGIAPAGIEDYHPEIRPDSHPVFWCLSEDGPFGLMTVACDQHGFQAREEGYVSKCDLCFDVRRFLAQTEMFPELCPAAFYTH
jgi:hypothetical protein